jgi:hypothetical protein
MNRQFNLILLALTFSRQSCRSVKWSTTLTSKSNFFKVRYVSIDDEGTILAQVAVAGAGNRNSMPQLDDSCPGASLERICASRIYLIMNEKVWDRCSNCYGTGKITGRLRPKRRCPACEGTGYVPNSVWVIDMPETKPGAQKTVRQQRQVKPNKPAKRN